MIGLLQNLQFGKKVLFSNSNSDSDSDSDNDDDEEKAAITAFHCWVTAFYQILS